MMPRVLEPEIMDQEEAVAAYARADFSDSNKLFVRHILDAFGTFPNRALDIGCGPGDVPILLAETSSTTSIVAVDASAPMLETARAAVKRQGLDARIALSQQRLPGLAFAKYDFDLIYSKDTLHHIPNPSDFWMEIVRLHSLHEADTRILVVDLVRPRTEQDARSIVESVAQDASPVLKQDFYNSLLAAFTPEEILQQLGSAGLSLSVAPLGSRHYCVTGVLPYRAR